jgi:L-alanine-DL-glutamate epimerase-like enolase superfamily enzyme
VKIAAVELYGIDLHYAHGTYVMSGGRAVDSLASTLVRVLTDDGLEGWGETCPLGTIYLAEYAEGARAALRELAPAVLGADPRNLGDVLSRLDGALMGHAYAKSAIDIACWDLLGKAAGLPVCDLLGGRLSERFALYVAVPFGPPDEMAAYVEARKAEGIRAFQLKIGGDPHEDAARVRAALELTDQHDRVIADANCAWRLRDAVVAAQLLEGLPVFFEQPCPTLEECVGVRRRTMLPMVLDEIILDVPSLLRAHSNAAMEAINLKINRVGGLTPAKLMRDLAQEVGLSVTPEASWGGDVVTAAVSHLAASTRPETLFTVSFMNDWVEEHVAGYEPRSMNGLGSAPAAPGLGITVDRGALGAPLAVCRPG